MTDMNDDTTERPRATLLDRTVCLSISKKTFGNRRKAALGSVTTAADKSLLGLSKRLLDSDELKAVGAVDSELRKFVESIAMPSMFKTGVWLIAIPLVEQVEEKLHDFKAKRQAAVEAFLDVYPTRINEIETRLADQFDGRNYPSIEKMREHFGLDWQYVTFGVPGSLKAIKASLFEEEKQKHAAKLQEAATEYRLLLRGRILLAFENLAKQLKTDATGKRKRIYEGQVEQVTQVLSLFEMQDATDDTDLAPIVAQARSVMLGVDVTQLRDDDAFRTRIEQGLDGVIASLSVITEDRSSREFEVDDDSEATV